ncbi:MAG: hypothetical protein ACRDYD_06840, partial [Acidimicrobiales bacterium]
MIEPINFGGALRRSWRLLAVLAVVFAVVAVLLPVGSTKPEKHNKLKWQASAVVGSVSATGLGQPPVGAVSILYSANNYVIKTEAAKQADPHKTYGELAPTMTAAAVSLLPNQTKKKSGKQAKLNNFSVIKLTTHESSRQLAVNLTNAYATAVGKYVTKQFGEQELLNAASASSSGKSVTLSPNGSG